MATVALISWARIFSLTKVVQTSVSTSHPVVHMDPSIFPEPHKFDPDRWIRGGEQLERYSVPFGKGSRRCIGMRYVEERSDLAVHPRRIMLIVVGHEASLTWSYTLSSPLYSVISSFNWWTTTSPKKGSNGPTALLPALHLASK